MANPALFADLPGAQEDFIVTNNQMGYMTVKPDPVSQTLIDFSPDASGPMLEIGAAYGVATIAALQKGARVIANDLDEKHLTILSNKIPEELRPNLKTVHARFPEEVHFEAETIGCALASRIIHFFDGETIRTSLNNIYRWLRPGGKFCMIAETPYLKPFIPFLPEYEARIARGEEWPGCFDNVHEIYAQHSPELVDKIPPLLHYLTEDIVVREFKKAGFTIEVTQILNRTDFPDWLRLDGRESVGVIGQKPA